MARGDALWGVSDLDLVIAFDHPNPSDTALKREVEAAVRTRFPGGDALVIQRIASDRLQQMSEGTRAYWLYSCKHDAEVLYGAPAAEFLPAPPKGMKLASLIKPIIKRDGQALLDKSCLKRNESRHIAKRILNGLALPSIAQGTANFIAPSESKKLNLPANLFKQLDAVIEVYCRAPELTDLRLLSKIWKQAWDYIETKLE